jgi:hypothetical protein
MACACVIALASAPGPLPGHGVSGMPPVVWARDGERPTLEDRQAQAEADYQAIRAHNLEIEQDSVRRAGELIEKQATLQLNRPSEGNAAATAEWDRQFIELSARLERVNGEMGARRHVEALAQSRASYLELAAKSADALPAIARNDPDLLIAVAIYTTCRVDPHFCYTLLGREFEIGTPADYGEMFGPEFGPEGRFAGNTWTRDQLDALNTAYKQGEAAAGVGLFPLPGVAPASGVQPATTSSSSSTQSQGTGAPPITPDPLLPTSPGDGSDVSTSAAGTGDQPTETADASPVTAAVSSDAPVLVVTTTAVSEQAHAASNPNECVAILMLDGVGVGDAAWQCRAWENERSAHTAPTAGDCITILLKGGHDSSTAETWCLGWAAEAAHGTPAVDPSQVCPVRTGKPPGSPILLEALWETVCVTIPSGPTAAVTDLPPQPVMVGASSSSSAVGEDEEDGSDDEDDDDDESHVNPSNKGPKHEPKDRVKDIGQHTEKDKGKHPGGSSGCGC